MRKKKVTKKTSSRKTSPKRSSKLLGAEYTIEHDLLIISGGCLVIILLAIFIF